jgi:hypothetical protein
MPCVIHDQRIGDDRVHRPLRTGQLALAHAVANDLAAAEFDFFAVIQAIGATPAARAFGDDVAFHFDDQVGIAQAHLVAHRGAIHIGIGRACDFIGHYSAPITLALNP